MVTDPLTRGVLRLGSFAGDESDERLIRRYAQGGDQHAFAAIVHRHGPMVFGVCRRTLGHVQDAEDAFQAVFIVLSRKASGVRGDGLSRWLYGVAVRVANKARVRRASKSRLISDREWDEPAARSESEANDWLPLLDSLLNQLSTRDRDPIVLCDVQGRSRTEAANELGIAEGTLSSRLARAREKLRVKLTLRGVTPGVALLATCLTPEAVPARVLQQTIDRIPSTLGRSLAEGALRTMFIAKAGKIAFGVVCLCGIGTLGFMQTRGEGGEGADPQPAKKEVAKPESPRAPAQSDAERFKGTWVVDTAKRNGGEDIRMEGPASWNGEEMTFDGENVRFVRFPGKQRVYRLDPGWDQKRIDFEFRQVTDGAQRITLGVPAIYRFEGGKLHIVLGVQNLDDRPDSFDLLSKGPPFTHIVLSKKKPGVVKQFDDDELRGLEGTWVSAAMKVNGVREPMIGTKLTFKGNRFTLRSPKTQSGEGEGRILEGIFTIDVGPSPKHLDLKIVSGGGDGTDGKTVKGIYSIDQRVLSFCVDEGSGTRPTDFENLTRPVMYFTPEGTDLQMLKLPPNVPNAAQSRRLRDLQIERIKALEEQLAGQFERVKIGKDPLLNYLDVVRQLADAELEIAGPAEHIKVMEKLLKRLQECEQNMHDLQTSGLQTKQAVAQVRAARLKAEIEVEKLRIAK